MWLTDRSISKSFLCHHCVVLYTVYVFYVRTAAVRSQHVAPRCTLRNSRPRLFAAAAVADSDAPEVGAAGTASAMLVHVFVLAASVAAVDNPRAAVGTPYERRQNGWLHAETTGDYKRCCRIVTNRISFVRLSFSTFNFFLGRRMFNPLRSV